MLSILVSAANSVRFHKLAAIAAGNVVSIPGTTLVAMLVSTSVYNVVSAEEIMVSLHTAMGSSTDQHRVQSG